MARGSKQPSSSLRHQSYSHKQVRTEVPRKPERWSTSLRKRNTAGLRQITAKEWSVPVLPGVSGNRFGRTLQGCRRQVGAIQTKRVQNAEKADGAHLEDVATRL